MIRHEFTFLTDCFFQKKVPAKGLDPASQALLGTLVSNAKRKIPEL